MRQSKHCGACRHFIRIKQWGGSRNGLCNKLDYNVHLDSIFAKSCKHYANKKYIRTTYDSTRLSD